MIKDFTPRLYQQTIFSTCVSNNTLVVLPTGLGKTNILMMMAAHRLKQYPDSKILVLAPTRPLIEQHMKTFKKHLEIDETKFSLLTGQVPSEKRKELFNSSQLIFSTPQGVENDLISKKISLKDVSLIAFDEAHKAVGDYSYVFIAKQYDAQATRPRVLALTASPGSDIEKIKEVCNNLLIEELEIRTEKDPDVKPYIKPLEIEWVKVQLSPAFKKISEYLDAAIKEKLSEANQLGYCNLTFSSLKKSDIIQLQNNLHTEISKEKYNPNLMKTISLLAEILKILHAYELLSSQGLSQLNNYFEKLLDEAPKTKVKAVQNLMKDTNFISAIRLTKNMIDSNVKHPKLLKLKEIIENDLKKVQKAIIFTQFRDTAVEVVDELSSAGISSKIFLGQQKKKDTGMSQKEQKQILEDFRKNAFRVLVSTSVGEEGLDIPEVDEVIFYEPVPSAIRTIQRRGRTARFKKGILKVLVTEGTLDVSYRWSAHHKEKRMHRTLEELKNKFKLYKKDAKKETKLDSFLPSEEYSIKIDTREKASPIIKFLAENNIKIELTTLDIGDYILSDKVGVEFKTVPDFVESIIDGRLLTQIYNLKKNFEKPILVIQGEENIFTQRKVHPNSIYGMISAITINFQIPIIQLKTWQDTANFFLTIIRREQENTKKEPQLHSAKPLSYKEQQEFIVSSFPGIGTALSKPLLKEFKTITRIVNAKPEHLEKVSKIGPLKAKELYEIFNKEYKE